MGPCVRSKTESSSYRILVRSPRDTTDVPSLEPNGTTQIPLLPMPTPRDATDVQHIEIPDGTDSSDSDDFGEGDEITADDFKPKSFSLETEADIAMDMDSVTHYFEDDDYPWEDMLDEYGSESDASTDNLQIV